MTAASNRTRALEVLDAVDASALAARVERIARDTEDRRLLESFRRFTLEDASLAQFNTCLMDNFRAHRNLEAYSLLYELNHRDFLVAIIKRLRFMQGHLDPKDILQDVFFSIFRYPHKFRDEKEFSFRNWSYSIIRNTILKHLRGGSSEAQVHESVAEGIEDENEPNPLTNIEDQEDRGECGLRWLLILGNYLKVYARLSERERLALQLVEVESVRYREASQRLDIKLENLKMVICRARKKIFRGISAVAEAAGGES
jgi:RNA polymerase sigma factor (sigma-70 family)